MKLFLLYENKSKAAVAIVYDDNANILLGKATNNDDRKGKWCFPAGGVEKGECPREAAARECLEETGFNVVPQQQSFQGTDPNIYFVVCRKLSGHANPNHEFSELQWVPWDKVLELTDLYPDAARVLRRAEAMFP